MIPNLLGILLKRFLPRRRRTSREQEQARTRARALNLQASALAAKDRLRFAFLPSPETDPIGYFPADLAPEMLPLASQGFDFVPRDEGLAGLDVVIVTAHGSDLSGWMTELRRQTGPRTLLAAWLFDNHMPPPANVGTSRAADFIFPSHKFASGCLANPDSVLAAPVVACSCQWTREEAATLCRENLGKARSSQLLVNYVDYEFSWRSELLRALKAQCTEADVFLMAPDDRSRYFSKTKAERMQEWLRYKAALILPVSYDLSTRVFDALLAGLVPVVPWQVLDFDEVVPPEEQERLGIVRVEDMTVPAIRDAAAKAVRIYDDMGEAGAIARHEYALAQHMLANRVGAILSCIREVAAGVRTVEYDLSRESASLRLSP